MFDIIDGPTKQMVRADGRTVSSSVTNVEIDTAGYALRTFRWTDSAKEWLRARDGDHRRALDNEGLREDVVKTYTEKELTSADAKSKPKAKSAYETIDGVRYDRATIEACRAYTAEDGFISLSEA